MLGSAVMGLRLASAKVGGILDPWGLTRHQEPVRWALYLSPWGWFSIGDGLGTWFPGRWPGGWGIGRPGTWGLRSLPAGWVFGRQCGARTGREPWFMDAGLESGSVGAMLVLELAGVLGPQ